VEASRYRHAGWPLGTEPETDSLSVPCVMASCLMALHQLKAVPAEACVRNLSMATIIAA
jgi:hypothetical protein